MSKSVYLWVKKPEVDDEGMPYRGSRVIGPCSFAEAGEEATRVSEAYGEELVAVYDREALQDASYQLAYPDGFDKIAGIDAIMNNDGEEYDKDPYFKGFRDGYNAARELTNE